MVTCELCGKEFKNTQGLRGHMTFVHGKTGSSKILAAPAATEQRLSELEQLLGIIRQNTEQATEKPASRLRARLELRNNKPNNTEPVTEQLSNINNKLEQLESIIGVEEPSELEKLLGITELPITGQLAQLSKRVTELTERLDLLETSKALSDEQVAMLDDAANLADKVDEWKSSHNKLAEQLRETRDLTRTGLLLLERDLDLLFRVVDAHGHILKEGSISVGAPHVDDKLAKLMNKRVVLAKERESMRKDN